MASTGTVLGRVIERQRIERNLARALLTEQQRIGQELHKPVGQDLAGLALVAERMAAQAKRGSFPDPAALTELSSELREAFAHVRSAVRGLLPPALMQADAFPAVLQELAASIGQRFQIACEVDRSPSLSISATEVAAHLYRIAAEAMTNAAKHARPTRIVVSLGMQDDDLVLRVRDNGVGIPNDVGEGGSGLHIMHHRANVINATLSVQRAAGGGTLVVCAVPRDRLQELDAGDVEDG